MDYKLSDIIQGCRLGHPLYQKQLYEKYYGYAFSICQRYMSSNEVAVELMNDFFVKVFNGIHKSDFPQEEPATSKAFFQWMKTIMVNTCINYLKSKAETRRFIWNEIDDSTEQTATSHHEAVSQLAYHELVKLVQQLSPMYRSTFSLYAIEGYSHEEISRMMEISVSTSKTNLMKARKNLRKLLETAYVESN